MKNSKVLTIAIAAYNMEQYLSRCLDSLVCINNLDDVEILIINDGSVDATLQIAQKYESLYPLSVKAIDKPNGGWGSVVNLAIMEATGKYFKLLDADDWYESIPFSEFVTYLSTVSCDLLLTPYVLEYIELGKKKPILFQNIEFNKTYDYSQLVQLRWGKDWFDLPSITYRTEILQKNHIIIAECFYADIEYDYLPLRYIKNFMFIDLSIYRYFIGRAGQSVSREGSTRHYSDHLKITRRVIEYFNAQKQEGTDKIYLEIVKRIAKAKICQNYVVLLCYYLERMEADKLLLDFDNFLRKASAELYNEVEKNLGIPGLRPIKLWRRYRYNIYQSSFYKLRNIILKR
ncbi:glycosyltransferase family 2 protein [Parabacteroides sp. AF17-3]|uniref:glycosyltransferase n=1 Tax=Parabacteroides sp. AF17-3 TaxID=2293113 RepID=UPI000EFF8A99|nr:glycosyltransferase family 2 protein [Parabacteroides sp. AF17-3]RKU65862.1 glycosyltransferase family 2 protein [Parabacteroides sp. AF17-3]